jgi:hypothetical protein
VLTPPKCATCSFEDVSCENAWQTFPLPATRMWDGQMFPQGSCGANATACVTNKTCAPLGQYSARMCGRRYVDGGQEQITCVDVPFGLPATGTVVGTLPQ